MELVYSKNYFKLAKIFVFRLLKMAINGRESSRLKKAFNVWDVRTKWNLQKNVWSEEKSMFSYKNWLQIGKNMGLPRWVRVENTIHKMEKHWLTGKEKVLDAVVSKQGHPDILQEHERTHHDWFASKRCDSEYCFLLPTPLTRFILFTKWPPNIIIIIIIIISRW